MAWFGTIPRAPSQKIANKSHQKTRGQKITGNGGDLLMPEVDPAVEYLLEIWYDVGRCASGMNGPVPLPATEIDAWQRGMGRPLTPPEFGAVMRMSRAYTSELRSAEDPDCTPPYGNPVATIDKAALSKKLGAAMLALKQARRK